MFFAEKLLVLLRDGRKLLGLLRSFDQFGNYQFYLHSSLWRFYYSLYCYFCLILTDNLMWSPFTANVVLEGACERVIVGDLYCDVPLGLYVIRGENVVLIGELVWHVLDCFLNHLTMITCFSKELIILYSLSLI
jgi:small nuclear ribonucleoprotein (snRNP)-like protein